MIDLVIMHLSKMAAEAALVAILGRRWPIFLKICLVVWVAVGNAVQMDANAALIFAII